MRILPDAVSRRTMLVAFKMRWEVVRSMRCSGFIRTLSGGIALVSGIISGYVWCVLVLWIMEAHV